jgi:Kyakuja-Dileera-Zisupton transposase
MLDVFGKNQGSGFDTSCQFKTTLATSDLGPQARELNFKCLVDGFHGHAHRRLCQLSHLTTYQRGLGLEDLGVCERAFSRSNANAGVVRHMSVFHRMQAIVHYFQYTDDMETYHNLSKPVLHRELLLCSLSLLATFLLNNYKQALGILENSPKILARIMIDMGISSVDVFDNWLDEEKEYLLGLKTEPEAETLQMEYYQKLINFCASE